MNTFLSRSDLVAGVLAMREPVANLAASVLATVKPEPDTTRDRIVGAMLDAYTVEELVDGIIHVTAMREAIARQKGDTWEAKKYGYHANRFREVKRANELHANKPIR